MTPPRTPMFLVDENLSPAVAAALREDGHRALHVNQTGHQSATDAQIMAWAARRDATIITKDRDFEEFLFAGRTAKPSVIRISERGDDGISGASEQARALRAAVPGLGSYLERGSAVTIDRFGLRVDSLPLARLETRRGKVVTWSPAQGPDAAHALERVRERRQDPPQRTR